MNEISSQRAQQDEVERTAAFVAASVLGGVFLSVAFVKWHDLVLIATNIATGVAVAFYVALAIAWLKRADGSAVRRAGSWCVVMGLTAVGLLVLSTFVGSGEFAGRSVSQVASDYADLGFWELRRVLWREFGIDGVIYFGSKAAAVGIICLVALRDVARPALGVATALRSEVVPGRGYHSLVEANFPKGKPWGVMFGLPLLAVLLGAFASGATLDAATWIRDGGMQALVERVTKDIRGA